MMFTIVIGVAAFIAAVVVVLGVVVAMDVTARREQGFISYLVPILIFSAALAVVASNRNLSIPAELLQAAAPPRPSVVVWFSRLSSLFLLMAATERIVSYAVGASSGNLSGRRAPLALVAAYLLMWATTVLMSAAFGAAPKISHEYFYTALIGCAALMVARNESIRAVELTRDAAMLFMLGGVLLIPVKTGMALETTYTQGLIPGIPRLAGLAAHAVSLAMLALVGLLCLWNRPYRARWANLSGAVLALTVLLLAQSKSAWIALVLCAGCIALVRWGRSVVEWAVARPNASAVAALLSVAAIVATALSGVVVFGELGARIGAFVTSGEGEQLMSMTGRDRIWEVALQEWSRNPAFGYGPLLFDESYRMSIGMPFATHGHNQLVDTLARSGVVGALGVTLYVVVLTYYSIRFAAVTGGLTLALLLLLLLRSISEVPFDLFGYSPENVPHFTLLMVIAGQCGARAADLAPAAIRRVQPYLYAR